MSHEDIGPRAKFRAVLEVAKFRPVFSTVIVGLGFVAAVLEGVGLSFLIPIIEIAQSGGADPEEASGALAVFADAYQFVGIPFELEFVVLGVIGVMAARFTASFGVAWLRGILRNKYERELKSRAFRNALDTHVSYFNREGTEKILNTVVTESKYAARSIHWIVRILAQGLLGLIYIAVAFLLAPVLTLLTGVVLGGFTYLIRNVIEPGFTVGSRVAEANEKIQMAAQAGIKGIEDVKLFGLQPKLLGQFDDAIDQYTDSTIDLRRNQAAIKNVYQFVAAVTIFVLIYLAISVTAMTLATLGVFLFAMFRLAPVVSIMNQQLYELEGDLPHVLASRDSIEELAEHSADSTGRTLPEQPITHIEFDEVAFSYEDGTEVLTDISFNCSRGESIAFVGQSGAGKSTVVSLLTRIQHPDAGSILANDVPIDEHDLADWRSRLAVVRQDPYIFNDTLKANVTVGKPDAGVEEIEQACELALVTEFLDDLPNGYETQLGDNGARLSGGQRQRIALARALLKDADVLVLDEATSDLDMQIEQQVQSAIETMDNDYITLTIAHRLSTIRNSDRIYTLEDGTISESGDHETLLESDEAYANLYAAQMGSD